MNDLCPKTNTPLKFIKAGVSRTTGKPYDGFWVCDEKGCKGPHIPGATYSTPATPPSAPSAPQSATQGTQGEGFWDKKALKQCLWAYWLKNSSEMSATWKEDVHLVFKEIETFADKAFSPIVQAALKANPNFLQDVAEEAPLPEAPPEVRVEDIPF